MVEDLFINCIEPALELCMKIQRMSALMIKREL